MADTDKILAHIARSDDPDSLRRVIANAKAQGAEDVAEAAFRRLISLAPGEEPGSLGHDFWRSINAFEHMRSELHGKRVKLQRTRLKVGKVGVHRTLEDWATGKQTEGFEMLMEADMPELSGEAIVLRHAGEFEPAVVDAARARLVSRGVEPASVMSVG